MKGALAGRVKSGLERGRLFLAMPEYQKRIERIAGFKPFEGTLNLEVDEEKLNKFLKKLKEKRIEGFEKGNEVFGSLLLYRVSFMGERAAIIRPAKTTHSSKIIEIIAPMNLREKFGLKDNDIVEIGVVE